MKDDFEPLCNWSGIYCGEFTVLSLARIIRETQTLIVLITYFHIFISHRGRGRRLCDNSRTERCASATERISCARHPHAPGKHSILANL